MALGGSNGITRGTANIERRVRLHALLIKEHIAVGMDSEQASMVALNYINGMSESNLKKTLVKMREKYAK